MPLARRKQREAGADLLYVGKISPHKAPHDLVKMLDVLRRTDDPAARLHLVGSPLGSSVTIEPALRAFIDELGLADVVNLAGSVSGAELEAYFRGWRMTSAMASDHEGFCVPLAEAMGHGVPIVAYGVTAVPETVGGAGLVLPDKSAVRPLPPPSGGSCRIPSCTGSWRPPDGSEPPASTWAPPLDASWRWCSRPSALRAEHRTRASVRGRSGPRREGRDEVDGTIARRGEVEGVDAEVPRGVGQRRPKLRIAQQTRHGVGDRIGVAGIDQDAGVAHDLGEGAGLVGETGTPRTIASMTGTPKPSCPTRHQHVRPAMAPSARRR